jgi:ferredoxin
MIGARGSRPDFAKGPPLSKEQDMALLIAATCVNCSACEAECPNEAISAGEGIYVIDPAKCTECIGFHDDPQCALICPVEDTCVVDNNYPRYEAA